MKNIVLLANHCCIRVDKQMLALRDRGYDVHLITKKLPFYHKHYSSLHMYSDVGQLMEAIRILEPIADIWHAHNEPSWYVSMVKEQSDKPVVLDVHDSFLARITPEEEEKAEGKIFRVTCEERNNFQLADALVFPAWSFGDLIREEFGLEQPHLVLPSYCSKIMYTYDARDWQGGLVYEGRVDLRETIAKNPGMAGFKYTDYVNFALRMKELGIPFHIYAGRDDEDFIKAYDDIAALHPPKYFDALIRSLSRHDWGLVGNFDPSPEWDVALPNKLFEYMAAGVPIIAMNAGESSRFIEKHGLGITVDSVDEIADRWGEHREWRNRLLKSRGQFTMERHIDDLLNLYGVLS